MQLISIATHNDLESEISQIDLEEDFDILLPFMSKNYMTDNEYEDLLDYMTEFADSNNYMFEIERDTQDRSFVYHFMKEED